MTDGGPPEEVSVGTPPVEEDMSASRVAAAGLAAVAAVGGCATAGTSGGGGSTPAITRDEATGIAEATLPNGLRILVLERHDAPVVSHQIWYRVGSVDERPGETGLAHYLEHVMFKGTKQIEKGQIDRITFQAGGANNATTWNDHTNYYFNFASSRWRLALEIESDRMRNCAFVPKEFEAERGAVLNEMHAGHDSPGGRLDEEMDAAAYMIHPYHHSTIGWQQEVESVARSTVIDFYDRHYMPNNATLVVVGDVSAEDVVASAARAFADVAPGTPPRPVTEVEPIQRGERRVVNVEETENPKVAVAWHTCRVGDDDDYVLDVASAILGTGKSSRLHRRLVEKDRTCVEVSAWNETRKFPGRFKVWCEGQQGADPRIIEAAVHEEIARLAAEPPSARELEKAKNNLLARDVYGQETVSGVADRIGYLDTVRSWRVYGEWPERVRAVTGDQVQAALRRYLVPTNRTVGWAVAPDVAGYAVPSPPRAGADGSAADPLPAAVPLPEGPASARKSEPPEEPDAVPSFRGGRTRALDLAIPPGPTRAVTLDPRVETLDNGMTVILQRRKGLPVVSFQAYVAAGQLVEAKPGLAWFTGDMLDEGAGKRTSDEIAETLDFLGATLDTSGTGAAARCLAKDGAAVLDLLADVLLRPRFDGDEIEKVRAALVSEIAADAETPSTVGRKAFLETLYGSHPYGRLSRGDAESVASITREDLVAHHARWYVPDRTVLAVVGDFDADAMAKAVGERFSAWKRGDGAKPDIPAPKPLERTVRVSRPMPGKTQSNVFIGNLAIRRTDPDYAALLVMDHILGTGPGFSDRLSKDLRDEQGLAYTVYGRTASNAGEEPGTFTGFIACLGDDLDRAVDGMLAHIRRIRVEPVSDAELADAKSYLTGSLVFRYETTGQVAAALVEMQRYGLGFDYPDRFLAEVAAVTKEDVLRVAAKHLHPDACAIVVSGWTGP